MELHQPTTRYQLGYSAVEALLVLAIVSLIGFVGWYVWHIKNSTHKSLSAASASSNTAAVNKKQMPKTTPSEAANITPPTATMPSLVIKEWGIKVKIADADKVTYTIGGTPNGSSGNADSIVSWATLKLNNSLSIPDKCKSLGFEVDQLLAAGNAIKIGKYYYGFSGTPTDCEDSSIDSLRSKIVNTELVNSAIFAQ